MRPCARRPLVFPSRTSGSPQDRRHVCRRHCSHEHQRPPRPPSARPSAACTVAPRPVQAIVFGRPSTNDEAHPHATQCSAASRTREPASPRASARRQPPTTTRLGREHLLTGTLTARYPAPDASNRQRAPRSTLSSPRRAFPPRTAGDGGPASRIKAGPPARASNRPETAPHRSRAGPCVAVLGLSFAYDTRTLRGKPSHWTHVRMRQDRRSVSSVKRVLGCQSSPLGKRTAMRATAARRGTAKPRHAGKCLLSAEAQKKRTQR
jgi:hypothetical protein